MTSEVVLTTYFTVKEDPQARSKRRINVLKHFKTWLKSTKGGARREIPGIAKPDEFRRIKVWYDSLQKVGCHGVIFHDCLSQGFIDRWTNDKVSFQEWELTSPRSVNDERYYCYLKYLEDNPQIERVFLLDLFDVEFYRNPFPLIDDSRYDILSGGDEGIYNDEQNKEKMLAAFGEAHYEQDIKLHAGTCGGSRESIMKLLRAMIVVFDDLTARGQLQNLNMAIYNKCLYDIFDKKRILYGYPLNSRFKMYEGSGDFAIRHK